MKIVVIGGSGLIGSKLVNQLRARGHEAVPASPSTGVDTLTGAGLAGALQGAQVVVDVSNSPSFADDAVLDFFTTSTKNLLAAARQAGVGHVVALSVVGTEGLPECGYFRAKLAQEQLIQASQLPCSIVHATQFFEFVKSIADAGTLDGKIRLPPALIQPIASDDVVAQLTEVVLGAPLNGRLDIAGPDVFRFAELVRLGLGADPRELVVDPAARYFGAIPGERSLVPGDGARLGVTHFVTWQKLRA